MDRIEKTAFISYRRTNASWATAVFHDLKRRRYDVFMDYNNLGSGDFKNSILENIRSRAHFIVLLTPSALESCHKPDDFLRWEIETALDARRNVVPLMFDGFDFNMPSINRCLTGKLAVLKSYSAVAVPPEYFKAAMDRLCAQYLSVALSVVLHPVSAAAAKFAKAEGIVATAALPVTKQDLTAEQWFERAANTDDLDEKSRCYDLAITLKPDYAIAYNNRGGMRAETGDLEGALKDYDEAIRLHAGYSAFYFNRAMARQQTGDLKGAFHDYNKAIDLNPGDFEAYFKRGVVRDADNDLEGAAQDFTQAIRLRPGDVAAYANRGLARLGLDDLDGALEDFNHAINLDSQDGSLFFKRGNVFRNRGELDAALQDYAEAIRLAPQEPYTYYNRAEVWKLRGNNRAAAADYQSCLDLDPELTEEYRLAAEQHIRKFGKRNS